MPRRSLHTLRLTALLGSALLLAGCSQWQMMKCVRNIVDRNAPYQSDADREDSEQLARQTCREQAEGRSR